MRRLTTFGSEDAPDSGSTGPAGAVDEEEDEMNSLLREKRKWLERGTTETDGQVAIHQTNFQCRGNKNFSPKYM